MLTYYVFYSLRSLYLTSVLTRVPLIIIDVKNAGLKGQLYSCLNVLSTQTSEIPMLSFYHVGERSKSQLLLHVRCSVTGEVE